MDVSIRKIYCGIECHDAKELLFFAKYSVFHFRVFLVFKKSADIRYSWFGETLDKCCWDRRLQRVLAVIYNFKFQYYYDDLAKFILQYIFTKEISHGVRYVSYRTMIFCVISNVWNRDLILTGKVVLTEHKNSKHWQYLRLLPLRI